MMSRSTNTNDTHLMDPDELLTFLNDIHDAILKVLYELQHEDTQEHAEQEIIGNRLVKNGTRVEYRFPASSRWFRGEVKQFHANDTYDIINVDGTLELGISSHLMRFETRGGQKTTSIQRSRRSKKDPIIFLGGTNGGSWGWQQRVAIPILTGFGVDYFDPQSVRDHEACKINSSS